MEIASLWIVGSLYFLSRQLQCSCFPSPALSPIAALSLICQIVAQRKWSPWLGNDHLPALVGFPQWAVPSASRMGSGPYWLYSPGMIGSLTRCQVKCSASVSAVVATTKILYPQL